MSVLQAVQALSYPSAHRTEQTHTVRPLDSLVFRHDILWLALSRCHLSLRFVSFAAILSAFYVEVGGGGSFEREQEIQLEQAHTSNLAQSDAH